MSEIGRRGRGMVVLDVDSGLYSMVPSGFRRALVIDSPRAARMSSIVACLPSEVLS